MDLADLKTPALILDRRILERNCAAMAARAAQHKVRLRPHLKTAKSAEVALVATAGQFGGITVSTLAEARYFAAAGFTDITYAVGIVAHKLDEVAALLRQGVSLTLLTDDPGSVSALGERAESLGIEVPLLIELDSGAPRAGVAPNSQDLLVLGRAIAAAPSTASPRSARGSTSCSTWIRWGSGLAPWRTSRFRSWRR